MGEYRKVYSGAREYNDRRPGRFIDVAAGTSVGGPVTDGIVSVSVNGVHIQWEMTPLEMRRLAGDLYACAEAIDNDLKPARADDVELGGEGGAE
jgi:hypothetical protein